VTLYLEFSVWDQEFSIWDQEFPDPMTSAGSLQSHSWCC